MRTPIAERLDIEFPIFAFSHCRDVIAAVSRAGGFGVLGALAFTPEELEIELNWIDEHVDGKPYGVDIVMPMKYVGKGGGSEASFDNLDAMIPQSHRDFVEELLERHHIPELPPDLETGTVKAAGLNVDAEAPGQVEVLYSDYRQVDGRWVPHKEVLRVEGQDAFTLTLESFTVNPPVDEKLFEKPAEKPAA